MSCIQQVDPRSRLLVGCLTLLPGALLLALLQGEGEGQGEGDVGLGVSMGALVPLAAGLGVSVAAAAACEWAAHSLWARRVRWTRGRGSSMGVAAKVKGE